MSGWLQHNPDTQIAQREEIKEEGVVTRRSGEMAHAKSKRGDEIVTHAYGNLKLRTTGVAKEFAG